MWMEPPAPPPTPARTVDVLASAGYLGALAGHGAALEAGVRVPLGEHLALAFDLGYGVLHDGATVEDRWWLIPSLAWVARTVRLRFDFGAGAGLGASSGYASFADYTSGPFSPVWAYQLVPAVRGHAIAAMPLTRTTDAFVRLDVAALLLSGNAIGSRVGDPEPRLADTSWMTLSIGAAFALL
jgi:hypothetical protein